jgi:hypothetical protein
MRGEGAFAENLKQIFRLQTRKLGLNQSMVELSSEAFRLHKNSNEQLSLF